MYQVQDREQTWLDLNLADAAIGPRQHACCAKRRKAWVNDNGNPIWLKDGSFLWFSERTGFKHLYRYRRDGSARFGRVTDGRWEVRTLYGVDEERGVASTSHAGAQPSHRHRHLPHRSRRARASRGYRGPTARIAPSSIRRSRATSTCGATSPRRRRCGSIALTAPRVRVIDANSVPALAQYRLSKPEFVEVQARDGFVDGRR